MANHVNIIAIDNIVIVNVNINIHSPYSIPTGSQSNILSNIKITIVHSNQIIS